MAQMQLGSRSPRQYSHTKQAPRRNSNIWAGKVHHNVPQNSIPTAQMQLGSRCYLFINCFYGVCLSGSGLALDKEKALFFIVYALYDKRPHHILLCVEVWVC